MKALTLTTDRLIYFLIIIIYFSATRVNAQATGNLTYNWAYTPALGVSGGTTIVNAMTKDNSGNVYITGVFSSIADFDPSSGISNLSTMGGNDIFLAKYDPSGNILFVKQIGGPNDQTAKAIVFDAANNSIYITGSFSGSADFDPSPAIVSYTSNGLKDIFLAKFDINGNYIYAFKAGSTFDDEATSVDIDASGNVYLTGYFRGTVDFDPSFVPGNTASNSSSQDIFIAKYDIGGNYIFSKAMGSTASNDIGKSIKITSTGTINIMGIFSGIADFDPSAVVANLVSANAGDMFIAQYDSNGNYVYANGILSISSAGAVPNSMAIDAGGSMYITGYISGNVDFDPSPATATVSCAIPQLFFAKYSSGGNYQFVKTLFTYNTYSNSATSICLDQSNNICIAGYYNDADFDPGVATFTLQTTLNPTEIFFAKYTNSGAFILAKSVYGDYGQEAANTIMTDNAGSIYIGGAFEKGIDTDPSTTGYEKLYAAIKDGLFAKYDLNGNYIWSKSIGGYGNDFSNTARVIKKDDNDNMYVAGELLNNMDFDPGPGIVSLGSNSDSYSNSYFAKYDAGGALIFAKSIEGSIESMDMDTLGNMYIIGRYLGISDFDPSPGTYTLTTAPHKYYMFFSKYDNTGNLVYVKSLNYNFMSGSGYDYNAQVAATKAGEIYIAGSYANTIDFDPSPAINALTSTTGTASQDIYIAKYDVSGNFVFAKPIYGSGREGVSAIDINSTGVCITGTLVYGALQYSIVDFDPSPATATIVGQLHNSYVAKYDLSGNFIYVRAMSNGTSGSVESHDIVLEPSGAAIVTGNQTGTAYYNYPTLTTGSISVSGAFITRYDASGNYIFVKGLTNSYSESIARDTSGGLYLAGWFIGTADFDPSPSTATLTAGASGSDIFIARYDSFGNYTYAKKMGGTGILDKAFSIAVSKNGNSVYAAGSFSSTVDFDPNAGVANLLGGSIPQTSFFAKYNSCLAPPSPVNTNTLAFYNICHNTSTVVSVVGTGSLTWWSASTAGTLLSPTSSYTTPLLSTGVYTYYAQSENSCLINPNRTLVMVASYPSPTITVNSGTLCLGNSFTLIPSGASTYTFSGGNPVNPISNSSYSVIGTSSVGCLSSNTAISNVTVQSLPLPTIAVNSGSICSGNSFTINASGANTYTFSGGSPVVSPSVTTSYSVSGTNLSGCISASSAISIVTVDPTPTITVNSGIICNGNSFTITPAGAATYSYSSGSSINTPTISSSYTVTGFSTLGCLSQAVSNVTLSIPLITINSGTLCQGSFFIFTPSGGNTYTYSSGSPIVSPTVTTNYSVTGTDINGCISPTSAVSSVVVYSVPVISSNSGSVCSGSSFTIIPSGANTYTYSGGSSVVFPTSTTAYSISGTSSNGCNSLIPAISNITVYGLPTISISAPSSTICAGDSIILTGSGANTYSWNTGSTSTTIVATPTISTAYSLTGINTNGCSGMNSFNVNVAQCTYIEKNNFESGEILFYPNPNAGKFFVKITFETTATIINPLGIIISELKLQKGENYLDISDFSKGLYVIIVKNGSSYKNFKVINQ